ALGGAVLLSWANPLSAQDIYWTSQQTIWGGNLDGSEIREIFNGTTSTPLMAGNAVDVAATATHIYWTDNGDPGNPAESKIWRAERNGDNPVVLVQPDPRFTAPQFLQIDEANNKIYFTCW